MLPDYGKIHMVNTLDVLKKRARQLKRELVALALAYRDPRTPWYARLVAAAVLAYALSPIDLIPDFIPVLGYLDDLILVPAGIALALRLIPPQVMADARLNAAAQEGQKRSALGYLGLALIATIWSLVAVVVGRAVWEMVFH